jgi:protein-S-isoprenylcysteine O-methyltransferase Ste14
MVIPSGWLLHGLWLIFAGYWALAALRVRATERREAPRSRLVHTGLWGLAGVLLFTGWLRIGPLAARFLPAHATVLAAGLVLTAVGLSLAIWARAHLGPYWSAAVSIKAGHQLVRTGPYAVVRHPIYTGLLLGIAGTAIAVGEVRGLLALGLAVASYWRKVRIEETWLLQQFGAAYEQYRREVRALIPFLI